MVVLLAKRSENACFPENAGRSATIYATRILPGCSINIQAKRAVENSPRYLGYNIKTVKK